MKQKIKNGNIYAALGICIVAVAAAAVISLTPSGSGVLEETGFSRVSIEWSERNVPTVPETNAVNIGVTGIRDSRDDETTAAKKEELPYSGSFAMAMGNSIIKDYSAGEMVYSETMGDWRVHNGVDFGGAAGNSVDAVADGRITRVYDDSFWGTVAEIDHGNGMTVRYCGLKSGSVLPEGAFVEKSEKIGSLGHIPVEAGDGDHLHIEVLIDGKNVDPLEALNKVRAE